MGITREDGACAALRKAVYLNTLKEMNAYLRAQGDMNEIPLHVKDFDNLTASKGKWY